MEIKVAMVRAGVTGRELARRLGASQTWVSTRLNGTTPLDLNELERIADALGVGVIDLLSGGLSQSSDSTHPNERPAAPASPEKPKRHVATRPLGPSRRDATRPPVPPTHRRPGPVRPGNRAMAA